MGEKNLIINQILTYDWMIYKSTLKKPKDDYFIIDRLIIPQGTHIDDLLLL